MGDISKVLKDNNFRFNKQFGQNFITDANLLQAMVADAGVCEDDTVLEIGAGAGTLTRAIAEKADKVYAFEIDRNLIPVLSETLKGLDDKVEVIFKDVMKVSDEELDGIIGKGSYKVVANLPYYITTPIIMRFLERNNKPQSLSVMVQKEVAERLTSKADCGEYGVITLSIALEGKAKITREVPRYMFTPQPNVDSAVVRIDLDDTYAGVDKKAVKKLIKSAFSMRRKTLVNNLSSAMGIPKDKTESALSKLGMDTRIRGEALTIDDYVALNDALETV